MIFVLHKAVRWRIKSELKNRVLKKNRGVMVCFILLGAV